MQTSQGTKVVTRHFPKDRTKDAMREEKLEVRTFEVQPARVQAGYGITIPLTEPRFANVKIYCEVSLPCYVEEVSEATEEAFRIAAEEVVKQKRLINPQDCVL